MEIYVCCDIMLLCALWVLTKSEYLIYALWELANHNSLKLDLIFNPRFPGVEFALHEMEVDGKKVNFFLPQMTFFCLKWLDACKPCWMKAILQSQWDYIITVNRWIGKQQNLEPYFHFIFSSWYEGSSARESVTGYLTNLFEDLDISGDLKKLQRNNCNDNIFPDQ